MIVPDTVWLGTGDSANGSETVWPSATATPVTVFEA